MFNLEKNNFTKMKIYKTLCIFFKGNFYTQKLQILTTTKLTSCVSLSLSTFASPSSRKKEKTKINKYASNVSRKHYKLGKRSQVREKITS